MSRHIEPAALNVKLYNWNPQFADWMLRTSVLSIQFLFHGCTTLAGDFCESRFRSLES